MSTAKALTCRVLRTASQLQALIPTWIQLLDGGARGGCYMNDPRWIAFLAGWDTEASPLVVVVEENGAIHAIAPFFVTNNRFRWRFSIFTLASFNIRMMRLAGNRIVLANNADVTSCLASIFETLAKYTAEFDLVFLDGIDFESELWRYSSERMEQRGDFRVVPAASETDVRFELTLPATFDEYFKTLGLNTRKSLKKRIRDLVERDGATLTRITTSEQVETFLQEVDEVYRDTWQAKTYGNRVRAIPQEIGRLKQTAEFGWLRSYILRCGEQPLAFQLGYQYEGVFHAMDFGFTQAAAESGPGAVLMTLMIEDLFQHDSPSTIDLGHGDSPQKHTFRGLPKATLFAYVVPKGRSSWLISVQRALTSFERGIRSVLVRLGIDRSIRRILKRKSK